MRTHPVNQDRRREEPLTRNYRKTLVGTFESVSRVNIDDLIAAVVVVVVVTLITQSIIFVGFCRITLFFNKKLTFCVFFQFSPIFSFLSSQVVWTNLLYVYVCEPSSLFDRKEN